MRQLPAARTFRSPLRPPARRALDGLRRQGLDRGFIFDLPPVAADRLLAESIEIDVPAGGVVYREGDAARAFVVLRGILRAFLRSADGREVTFRYGRPGDVLALASVVGDPMPLTIQAMSPSSVLALRVDTLRQSLATDPVVARACALELARQLNEALADVAATAFGTVRQRLARQLLDLAEEGDGPYLVAHISHQELADSIASAREVVSRTVHDLKADGLIDTPADRTIALVDPALLAREIEADSRR